MDESKRFSSVIHDDSSFRLAAVGISHSLTEQRMMRFERSSPPGKRFSEIFKYWHHWI